MPFTYALIVAPKRDKRELYIMQQKGATKLCKVYNLYMPRQEPRRAAIFARLEEIRAAADVIRCDWRKSGTAADGIRNRKTL